MISADIPKILALEPDLVLSFSDLQPDIVAELIRTGVAVHAFNQRDLAAIFAMFRMLGALIGVPKKAEALARTLEVRLLQTCQHTAQRPLKPRIYLEEWDTPMISGIRRVSELIGAAGGQDILAEMSLKKRKGTHRIVRTDHRGGARHQVGYW